MDTVSLADAKARLGELVDLVERGNSIDITRRGKLVARLTPPARPRRSIDVKSLKALTDSMPYCEQSAGEFIRTMRDGDRY